MKNNYPRNASLQIALATLWLVGSGSVPISHLQAQPAPPPPATASDASTIPPSAVTPPPSIVPNSPLAQVIQLVQAGVDQGVIFI